MSGTNDDYSEIVLDGMHFLIEGKVIQESAIDRLAPKQTTGDYTLDSNDLLSAWVTGDLSGGHGVIDLREGVDDNRYRFGNLYTRYPNQISKPFAINTATLGTGAIRPLGDMTYSGTVYRIFAEGVNLYADSSSLGALSSSPSSGEKLVMFTGTAANAMVYIPRTSGYSVYNPASTTLRNVASPDMKSFVAWDNKLIAISRTGQLYYAITATAAADTTFTSYGTQGKLDPAFTPISLVVYYNRSGEPAVHVITDQNVWIFDPSTPRLYPIPDFGSVHPRFGKANAVWRGELYVAAGMDILSYNGNVVRNVGLSRDHGLPYLYQGYVVDMVSGQNSLYAYVQGQTTGGVTYFSVHEYSGLGWHCIYLSNSANTPTQMAMSNATTGGYRLYWGLSSGGTYYYQQLPESFTNPRAAIEDGAIIMGDYTNFTDYGLGNVYETLYYLETGRFDGNMKGYLKIANAVTVDIRSLAFGYETYTLKYRINNATSWTTLGTATTSGRKVFPFGTLTDGIYPGVPIETLELRHELQDEIPTPYAQSTSFVMNFSVTSYLIRKNPSLAWTCTVNLNAPHNDQSPENMRAKLTALRTSGTFFPAIIQGTTYRCRLSGVAGARQTGQDTRGMYSLSIIEIPNEPGIAS